MSTGKDRQLFLNGDANDFLKYVFFELQHTDDLTYFVKYETKGERCYTEINS